MEGRILQECQFNILQPTSLTYFDLLNLEIKLNRTEYCLGQYLLEISLLEIEMRKYMPSTVAISTLYFLGKLMSSKSKESNRIQLDFISQVLIEAKVSQTQIKACAR